MEFLELKRQIPSQGQIAYNLLELLYKNIRMKLGEEVYPELESKLGVTPELKSLKYDNGNNIWKARVRAAKHNTLKAIGLVINIEDGVWEITDKGKERYEEMKRLGLYSVSN